MAAEKGVSDFDQTFNNTTSLIYDLPVGRGGQRLQHAAVLRLRCWRMASLADEQWSGQPCNLQLYSDGRAAGFGHQPLPRGSTAPQSLGLSSRPGRHDRQLPQPREHVDSDRPIATLRHRPRSYGLNQIDLGISKSFTITERVHIQFRSEMFNACTTPTSATRTPIARRRRPSRRSGGFPGKASPVRIASRVLGHGKSLWHVSRSSSISPLRR